MEEQNLKKTIGLILSTIMCISLLPITVKANSPIKIGDYIQIGTYDGEPIIWCCVGFEKISGYNENGSPIIDLTDSITEYKSGYLPLMLSDEILTIKIFDGSGKNIKGSHSKNLPNDINKYHSI